MNLNNWLCISLQGPQLWKNFVDKVLRPNLTFLECFAATTSSKMNDKNESDSRVFLGNFVAAMMSPDIDRQVTSTYLDIYDPFINAIVP